VTDAFGHSSNKLDEKGRVILPPRARAALATGAYLTRGHDNCVYLFSKPQFDDNRERNRANTPPGMPAIAFERIFYSSVVTADVDKQGRVTIPPLLRQYADLSRDLVIIGLEDRMEIWDAARWQSYLDEYVDQYAQLYEEVS
jgi:MraZ protein